MAENVLLKYWPVLVGVLAAAAAWGSLSMQVSYVNDGQKELGKTTERILTRLDVIGDRVATTTADSRNANQDIADLRTRMHAMEARRP